MKASSVSRLYELYRAVVGPTEPAGRPIEDGGRYFSPLPPARQDGLWVSIEPDTHNPQGKYTHSATLKVYELAGPTCFDQEKLHIELQAFESPDELVPQDILVIQSTSADTKQLASFFEHLSRLIPGSSFASLNAT